MKINLQKKAPWLDLLLLLQHSQNRLKSATEQWFKGISKMNFYQSHSSLIRVKSHIIYFGHSPFSVPVRVQINPDYSLQNFKFMSYSEDLLQVCTQVLVAVKIFLFPQTGIARTPQDMVLGIDL